MTDLAGCLNFGLIAFGSFILGAVRNSRVDARALLLTVMVIAWSVRLGVFLELRLLSRRRDNRFDGLRERFWHYLRFWATQAMWVWLVSQPALLTNTLLSPKRSIPLAKPDLQGFLVWSIGFALEWVADHQKNLFNATSRRRKSDIAGTDMDTESDATSVASLRFIDHGLWKYCRHPNYFGEIMLWAGAWYVARNGLPFWLGIFASASPIVSFILLVFVSGIPVAEKRDERRFGKLASYLRWKFITSPLIPFPPLLYARLPFLVRRWFLFDTFRPTFRKVRRTLLTTDRYVESK